jgi:hypothetical protein
MEYFSQNAVLLGVMLCTFYYTSNLLYIVICLIWRIKVLEFGIFSNPWFTIHQKTISDTKYILGWLPFNLHIKPLGLYIEPEEKQKMSKEELARGVFSKPTYVKKLFRLAPRLLYLVALLLVAYFVFDGNFISGITTITNIIADAFRGMFATTFSNVVFLQKYDTTLMSNKLGFAFTFFILVYFLLIPISILMNWYAEDKIINSGIAKFIGSLITLFILWLVIWKIPSYIFSFFSLSQAVKYISSLLIGFFLSGIIYYILTLTFAQLNNRNNSKSAVSINKPQHVNNNKGQEYKTFMKITVSRKEIELGDINKALEKLNKFIEYGFVMKRYCEDIEIAFTGYEKDSRALWEIEEVRNYVRKLDEKFPYWFYFLTKEGAGLHSIVQCFLLPYLTEEGKRNYHPKQLSEYLAKRGFPAMNYLCGIAGNTEDEIEEMTYRVMNYLTEKRVLL